MQQTLATRDFSFRPTIPLHDISVTVKFSKIIQAEETFVPFALEANYGGFFSRAIKNFILFARLHHKLI